MEVINHECYVSLEVAKLLKQAGFDWKCGKIYYEDDGKWELEDNYKKLQRLLELDYCLLAPTLDVAQRWLREEKNINIEVKILSITSGQLMWYAKIYYLQKHNGIYDQVEFIQHTEISYDSYEQALEAGIKKALEVILEKGE